MFEVLLRGLFFLVEAALELIFSYLFYSTGWLALRLLTLGRYPKLPLRVTDPMSSRTSWIAAFGFLCLVGVPLAILAFLYG